MIGPGSLPLKEIYHEILRLDFFALELERYPGAYDLVLLGCSPQKILNTTTPLFKAIRKKLPL